jgi:autotransporter-associated beta strand protein
MHLSRWRHWLKPLSARSGPSRRPRVEALEDRTLLSASLPLNPVTWTALGPAPVTNGVVLNGTASPASGRLAAIAADPTDAHTLYVAAASGGVWKTADAQDASPQWTPLTDHVTDANGNPVPLFMGALAVAHGSGGNTILYAGTGSADNSVDSFYGRGILVSTDGGATWAVRNAGGAFDRLSVARIAVNPQNPAVVYAALADSGANGSGASNAGIWESTDFGTTWTNTTAGSGLTTSVPWSDVVVDPVTPTTLYAAVGAYYGSAANGVYVSTNGGGTWARAGNFLGASGSGTDGTNLGRITLAVAPGAAHFTVYAAVSNPTTYKTEEILKSTDGGTTWTVLMSDGSHTPLTGNYVDYMGSQGWFDQTLAVDPNNAGVVYAGGAAASGVIESTNGGSTWADISTGANGQNGPHVDHHAVAFDAAGKLLDGDDGGLWRLDNPAPANVQWTDLNGNLQTIQFIGTALDPASANIVYGGSQDNGTAEFNDSLGWTQLRGGDGGFVRVDPSTPTTVYHEYSGGTLERSDTSGSPAASWTDITPPGASGGNFYVPFVLDPSNPQRLLYGTATLYQSTNRGAGWTAIGTPGTAGFNPGGAALDALAVSANGSTIYVTAGGHNFVTTNDGLSWTNIDVPGFTDGFAAVAVDPASAQTVYLVRNHFTGGAGGHVFKTTNSGATWTDVSGNLPNIPSWSIALDSRGTAASRALYLGTDTGVYESTDGGTDWAPFRSGLPNAQVRSLEIAPGLGILAAGTYGRGLFEVQPGVLAQVVGGVLTIQADAGGDDITLEVDPNNSTLLDVFQSDPESLVGQFSLSSFTSVSVTGGVGDDSLWFDYAGGLPGKPIAFDGGAGGNFLGVFDSAPGNPFTAITAADTGPAAGSLTLTPTTGPAQVLTFTNVTVTQENEAVASLTVNLPAGAQGTLEDDATPKDGFSLFAPTNGASPEVFFNSPGALTVRTAGGGSQVQLAALDSLSSPAAETFAGSAGDVFQLQSAAAVASTTSVTLTAATLDLNGLSPTFDGLGGTGTITDGSSTAATLTVGANGGSGTFAGVLQDGSGKVALTKNGSGTQTLAGTSTYSGGTTIGGGTLQVDGSIASAVTVNASGTLDGTGTTGTVSAAGTVAPGDAGPGVLTTGALSFATGSAFDVVIGGATAGNGSGHYAQDNVASGTVTIAAGVKLNLTAAAGFTPTAGAGYVILRNQGGQPVSGTFDGLPQGAAISSDFLGSGLTAYITYTGGSGNDVAVVFSQPPLPDLAPGTPQGWGGPLIVATQPNVFTTAAVITPADTVYAAAGFINQGTAPVTAPYADQVLLDGQPVTTYLFNPPQNVGIIDYVYNVNLGRLAAGSHTVTVNADYQDVLLESTRSNNTQSYTFTVTQAPAITSANNALFTVGQAGTFTFQATGFPTPTLTESGNLPPNVKFTANADGTATLAGTPAAGSGGPYSLTVTAHNGAGADVKQTFTLTVDEALSLSTTAGTTATFTVGGSDSISIGVNAGGYPLPTLSESGLLPAGVKFNPQVSQTGDAVAGLLSGTPVAGSGGTYPVQFTAHNGSAGDVSVTLTLTVDEPPSFLSQAAHTFTAGVADSFPVSAEGFPVPTLKEDPGDVLPPGISFQNNIQMSGNSIVGQLTGKPAAGSGGTYTLHFSATNGIGVGVVQTFVLTVQQAPAFTSANGATFTEGSPGGVAVTTSGFPAATLSESGALPPGVRFDPGSGTLGGTPAFGSHGTYTVTLIAANGVGGGVSQTFTLVVDQAVLAGPLNLGPFVAVQMGPLTHQGKRRKTGGTYLQTVTVSNTSPYVIQGPIALVLSSLRPARRVRRRLVRLVSVLGASGFTVTVAPGSPFVLGPPELAPGAAVIFNLTFRVKGAGRPGFSPIALAGYPQP